MDDYYTKEQTNARIKQAKDDLEEQIQELSEEVASGQTDIQSEIDALETSKADKADVYDKQETDVKLAAKANLSDVYSKDDIDGLLATKASTATTDALNTVVTAHTSDDSIHVSSNEKTAWNNKLDQSALNGYATQQWVEGKGYITGYTESDPIFTGSPAYTITNADKTTWGTVTGKADTTALTAVNNDLTAHTSDQTIHVTATEKATWNAKQDAISDLATIRSNASNAVAQLNGYTITSMTKTQFDSLAVKDPNTIYFVKD